MKFFGNAPNTDPKLEIEEASFELLPIEIILIIFSYLSKKDLISASIVSKTWLNLTSDKSLLHHFYKRSTGWCQRNHKPSGIKFTQVVYTQKRIDRDLNQIAINFSEIFKTTISFQDPKDPSSFKKKLTDHDISLIKMPLGNFKTEDISKALVAMEDFLPPKLLNFINQDLEEGSALIRQVYKK